MNYSVFIGQSLKSGLGIKKTVLNRCYTAAEHAIFAYPIFIGHQYKNIYLYACLNAKDIL